VIRAIFGAGWLLASVCAYAQGDVVPIEDCSLREGPSRESLLLSGLANDAKGSVYVFSGRDISYQLISDQEGVIRIQPYQAEGVITRFCSAYDEELVEVTFSRPDGVVETSWVPASGIILKNISHSGWAQRLDQLEQQAATPSTGSTESRDKGFSTK